MGICRTYGTSTHAPEYSSTSIGTPSWSGLPEAEFTAEISEDLRVFIEFEAARQGHNDSVQNRVGENRAFFHDDFFGGWPQRMWLKHYEQGVVSQSTPREQRSNRNKRK